MSELKDNLDLILQEKSTKIIPENIRKGTTIFNVTGEYGGNLEYNYDIYTSQIIGPDNAGTREVTIQTKPNNYVYVFVYRRVAMTSVGEGWTLYKTYETADTVTDYVDIYYKLATSNSETFSITINDANTRLGIIALAGDNMIYPFEEYKSISKVLTIDLGDLKIGDIVVVSNYYIDTNVHLGWTTNFDNLVTAYPAKEVDNANSVRFSVYKVNSVVRNAQVVSSTSGNPNNLRATILRAPAYTGENLLPENIKKDITIFGVTGTLKSGEMSSTDYQTALNLCDSIQGTSVPVQGHIYGIKRLRTSSSSEWERTDNAVGLIANATHNGSEVQNDFDNLYPWSSIISYNYDSSSGLPIAYYGDSNFTFTPTSSTVNVFTKIPRFWFKRWVDTEDYEHIQIADFAATDFIEVPECSVARYSYQNSTQIPRSISGKTPLINTNVSSYRTGVINNIKGKACLLDIETLGIIKVLYLIEYANYDSQNILGYGIYSASTSVTSGGCNNLGMKSGCLINDKLHSVVYRGMEDLFGNISQYVDGIILKDNSIYVCYEKANYDNTDTVNYTKVAYDRPNTSGYINSIGYDENNPLIMLPTTVGSTNSIRDYYYYKSGTQSFRLGGDFSCGALGGLFYSSCDNVADIANPYYGTRFMLK